MTFKSTLSVVAVTALLATGVAGSAQAAGRDTDHDGIPNRWEKAHRMNPHRASDARADFDGDRLSNVREYRLGTKLRVEDTDGDGDDDGDEVTDGLRSTRVRDTDTDNDGLVDGDEDADRDGVANEDEDDAAESCRRDDDDRDGDAVDDEDENELSLKVGSADSDHDGLEDGDEDADEDGEANEDGDDHADDVCDGDFDGDGEDDEDESDVFGVVRSFDASTGTLVVDADGFSVTGLVTDETEIKFEDVDEDDTEGDRWSTDSEDGEDGEDEGRDATTADLAAGVRVAELEVKRRDAGGLEIEELEIYLP